MNNASLRVGAPFGLRGMVSLMLVVCLSGSGLRAADGWTTYRSKIGTNNLVKVEGTSTLHDWRCISRIVSGALETGPGFNLDPATLKAGEKLELRAQVTIPARSLKSVQKDFTPYSTGMDDVMYQKLREEQVKVIVYRLEEISLREVPASAEAPLKLEAKGSLAVAGVTNVIKMPVDLLRTGAGFKVTGGVAAKMTDFKVEPPVVGPIKTGDDVQLSFTWFAEPKK